MSEPFLRTFTAAPEHIDELGHVNNAVWVQWIQELATAHWNAAARPEDRALFYWVVTRHEIDYRGNVDLGQAVTGETWIEGGARGATSVRRVDFRDAGGKLIVSAATTWAMLDRASNRLVRVRPEVLAPFTASLSPCEGRDLHRTGACLNEVPAFAGTHTKSQAFSKSATGT